MDYEHAINVCLTGDAIKLSVLDQMSDIANAELNRVIKGKRNAVMAALKQLSNPLLKTRQRSHLMQVRPGGCFEALSFLHKNSSYTEIGYAQMFGDACVLSLPEFASTVPIQSSRAILKNLNLWLSRNGDNLSEEIRHNLQSVCANVFEFFEDYEFRAIEIGPLFQFWCLPKSGVYEHGFHLIVNASETNALSA